MRMQRKEGCAPSASSTEPDGADASLSPPPLLGKPTLASFYLQFRITTEK